MKRRRPRQLDTLKTRDKKGHRKGGCILSLGQSKGLVIIIIWPKADVGVTGLNKQDWDVTVFAVGDELIMYVWV
jgi:hypothetical protein